MELSFYNGNNEMTFSGDGLVYSYLGRASASSILQANGIASNRSTGYSTYTFNWPADIIVVLPVKTNGLTAVRNITQSGSTWTIEIIKSNGTIDADGFSVQEYTEVYVYGIPAPGTASQFLLYDVNGNITGDLSRTPLICKGILSLSSSNTDNIWAPPVAISSPGIVGSPLGYSVANSRESPTSSWIIGRTYSYGWILRSDGAIQRTSYQVDKTRDDGGNAGGATVLQPVNAIVTTVQGL